MGFYQPDTLIADAQRHGVEVHSPCFKWSGWHTRFVGDSVYVGLRWIRGLGPHVLQTLEKTTKSGQFKDLNDVFRRCHFDRDVWIVLAKANVFRAWIPEGGDRRFGKYSINLPCANYHYRYRWQRRPVSNYQSSAKRRCLHRIMRRCR